MPSELAKTIRDELQHPERWTGFDGFELRHANGWFLWISNEWRGLSLGGKDRIGGARVFSRRDKKYLWPRVKTCLGQVISRSPKEPPHA
jgi:hypothetical protein